MPGNTRADSSAAFVDFFIYLTRFPTIFSPSLAPTKAREKAITPPTNILVRLKWIKLYGVKMDKHNIIDTDKNAPTAGS